MIRVISILTRGFTPNLAYPIKVASIAPNVMTQNDLELYESSSRYLYKLIHLSHPKGRRFYFL